MSLTNVFAKLPTIQGGKMPTETRQCAVHGGFKAINFIGKHWTRCPLCESERSERKAENDRSSEAVQRQIAIANAMRHAAIPPRFADRTLDTYRVTQAGQADALAIANRYASDVDAVQEDGRCLVLCGKPGTGKTHLAVGVAKRFIAEGYSARFTSAMNAIRAVRDTYRKDSEVTERQAIEDFAKPDLVIIDEVGQQLGTEAEKVTLFDLINARYERMKPMIVISNLTIDEVRGYIGDRAFDRLRENGGMAFAFSWDSYRRGEAQKIGTA